MQLYMSNNSPYARRVRITVIECGLQEQVENIVISSFDQLKEAGPGGKIPVLITDSGVSLSESLILTRYLNTVAGGHLLPDEPAELEHCLALEAVGSLLMDCVFARSLEKNQREEAARSGTILDRENARAVRCYDTLSEAVARQGEAINLGSIAVVAALGYADWRTPEDNWREGRPTLQAWYEQMMLKPSCSETAPSY